MMASGKQGFWIGVLLLGMGLWASAAEFAAPAEGPVAFRRDKIPLDTDVIRGLSRQLEDLARSMKQESAQQRRGTAQMLALSVALDPGNGRARDLLARYRSGKSVPASDARKLVKIRARLWQYARWLETPAAGSQGRALAACLLDVLALSDPKDPRAVKLRQKGEQGAWTGWVPELAAYQAKAVVVPKKKVWQPKPKDPGETGKILLADAEVGTLLWRQIKKGKASWYELGPASLRMGARRAQPGSEGDSPRHITIGNHYQRRSFEPLSNRLHRLLKAKHNPYPEDLFIWIGSKELKTSLDSKKRQSISAAVMVLANAAITGREPRATIIGKIDEKGAYKLPTGFWYQLRSIGEGKGLRLVLPASAAAHLPSMLALGEPGFFLEHEVLLASNCDGLFEASAKVLKGPLGEASAIFREIQKRRGKQDVGQYITNRFVRQRMAEVLKKAPNHYSAKMLLVQAAGNRPIKISRKALASELRLMVEQTNWLFRDSEQLYSNEGAYSPDDFDNIGKTYENCRSRVDELSRLAERDDEELVKATREFIAAMKALYRSRNARGSSYSRVYAVRRAARDVFRIHGALVKRFERDS